MSTVTVMYKEESRDGYLWELGPEIEVVKLSYWTFQRYFMNAYNKDCHIQILMLLHFKVVLRHIIL